MAFGGLKCMKKGQELKTIIAINYQGRGGGKAWQSGTKSFFFLEEVPPSPQKSYFLSLPPSHSAFSANMKQWQHS